jgi:hypothetical protein
MRVSAEVMVSRVDEGGDRDAGDPVGAWESWGAADWGSQRLQLPDYREFRGMQCPDGLGGADPGGENEGVFSFQFSVLSFQFSVFSSRLGVGLFAVEGFPFAGTVVW